MQVVSSRNFFIDTSSDLNGQAGDNVTLHLGGNGIRASDGQLLRISVMSFAMYRNFHGVNQNNSKVSLEIDGAAIDIAITLKNYATVGDIVSDFANKVKAAALAHAQTNGSSATNCSVLDAVPLSSETMASTGDRLMSFNLSFDQAHNIGEFKLRCFTSQGESFAILGGDRLADTSSDSSLDCSVESATVLRVVGRYPMQRHTDHHVFLRTDLPSTNIETSSLQSATGPFSTHTLGSNILGQFEVDTEYVHFNSATDSEYFLVLTQRSLSTMRLFLTDSKNRPIGRLTGSGNRTAAGTGDAQSTTGNLNFSCMLRIDVLQVTTPRTLQTNFAKSTPVNPKDTGPLMSI